MVASQVTNYHGQPLIAPLKVDKIEVICKLELIDLRIEALIYNGLILRRIGLFNVEIGVWVSSIAIGEKPLLFATFRPFGILVLLGAPKS